MNISETLRQLRGGFGYAQKEVAAKLTKMGQPTTDRSVSRWESGVSQPSIEQFIALCELYSVADVGSVFGSKRGLNELGLSRLCEYESLLRQNKQFVQPQERDVKLYSLSASAGTGNFADDETYEIITFPEDEVPDETDYAVRITGDSMETEYHNRQIVFVKSQNILAEGEVGIFTLNGDIYIKMLGHKQLISLNTLYRPIDIYDGDSLYVLGKIVGKAAS